MATTVNTLETDTEVFKGDRVVADGVERSLGDVTEGAISLVSSIDPFGDGSLVAKYELDSANSTTDLTTTNNLTVASYSSGTGKFGSSAIFNGSTNYIEFPDTMLTTGVPFGCSFWTKVADVASSKRQLTLRKNVNVEGFISSSIWNCKGDGTTTLVNNTWYFITIDANATNTISKVYSEAGTLLDTVTGTAGLASGGFTHNWYGRNDTTYYASELDQLEFYTRGLTDTEAQNILTQSATKYSADFNTPLASIPTSVYRLDHDDLTIDGTPTATTATVLDSRTGLIASGDTVLLDGVGVVCNPVVEGTVGSIVTNDEFETVLYTADTAGGKTIPMVNLDTVDFAWIKNRDNVEWHYVFDSIRGNVSISTNDTAAETTSSARYSSATVTLSSNGIEIVDSSYNSGEVYFNGRTYVAWCASLPNHTPSNTAGTITSETKANSFMSVVSYTGTGVAATVGHGLSSAPDMVITKDRSTTTDWAVYNSINGAGYYLELNNTDAIDASSTIYPTAPTSSVMYSGTNIRTGAIGSSYVAYCFTSVAGVCKVGSYTGTGAAGNAVDCGFEPAWVMVKRTDGVGNWVVLDNKRDTDGILDSHIYADASQAELTNDVLDITPNSSGFSVDATNAIINASGGTYIYLAIAKEVDGTTPKYDLTYPTTTAPTRIALSGNDIVPTVASDIFDGTDTFTKTYNKVTKTARDVEYGFVADEEVEVIQLNINQNMEP